MVTYAQENAADALRVQQENAERFCRAMSERDLDGVMRFFWNSPDLVNVLWGTVVRGHEAARAVIRQLFEEHPSVRLVVNECSYIPAGDDGIIAVGTATYELRDRQGQETRMVERWTDLRRLIDGEWVVVLNHATVVPE